ncbi:MAG: Ig-like domain-containing protein, partial [Planctomycetota bacterium]
MRTEPNDNATLFLNDSVRIDFSQPIDFSTVNLSTVSFQVLDGFGTVIAEPVAGSFAIGTSPGDTAAGRRLLFEPRLPTNDQFNNGGFRPGRSYIVQLVGGSAVNGTILRDTRGRPLETAVSFRFNTANGGSASQLFRDTILGGPRRVGLQLTPAPDQTGAVQLNELGSKGLEVRLRFDQPLNPSSANVPVAIPTDPLTRSPNNRGRVYLEYDDPVFGENVWLPADTELEVNAVAGATLVLRPLGVLPNNAVVRVIVERTLEDISGESNVANPAFNRVFGTFRTRRAYDQQFDAVVQDFLATSQIDLSAAFPEPVAEVGPGYVKAGFDFEGSTTNAEFEPAVPETILNTDFTVVTPKEGAPLNVAGGKFNFRNVRIPPGRTVRGTGSKPMVFLVTGSFVVEGTLSV